VPEWRNLPEDKKRNEIELMAAMGKIEDF